jgi:hypothetical protein
MKKTLKKENEHAQLVEDDQNNFFHTISIKFNHPMRHQSDKKVKVDDILVQDRHVH